MGQLFLIIWSQWIEELNSRLYSLRVEDDHNLKVHRWGYSATTLLGQNVGLGLISSYQYIWNASLIFVLNALVRFVLAFYAETLHEISVSKNVGPFFCKFLFLPNCALLYFFQLNFKFLLEPNSTLKPFTVVTNVNGHFLYRSNFAFQISSFGFVELRSRQACQHHFASLWTRRTG